MAIKKLLQPFIESYRVFVWCSRFPGFTRWLFARGNRLQISRHQVHIPKLPPALQGLRVLHLTDFHAADFMEERRLEEILRISQSLKPDLIALTGDYIGYTPKYYADRIRRIASLKAPLGVFAVLGNHDRWQPFHNRIVQDFEAAGVTVLQNANRFIERSGARLCMMGVDDHEEGQPNLDAAAHGSHQAHARILLAHNPDTLFSLNGHAPHLVLTGHTHGGQINFPVFGPLTYFCKYVDQTGPGLSRSNGTYIYNSRGLGMSMLPVRIRCRPEIGLFTLDRKAE